MTITEYSLTASTTVNYKIQKERNLYSVFRLRGETEHETNDNVTIKTQDTFNTAHMNTGTWVRSSFLLVRFLSSWFTLHHMAQGCCACHLIHAWSVRFSFDFESSIPFYFLIFSFFRHFFHYFEGRSKPVHSAWKGMDSLDDSYLLTLLVKTIHKENGTELQSKWCWHLQKANTQFSDPRDLCPEEPMEIRLKLFSAQLLRQSAQYLRSSCRFVRRMWHLPW